MVDIPLMYLLIFIAGLCIGSFLNVVVLRLQKEEDFVRGRSYCPHCKHSLKWFDLIPVVSFLMLKGTCRYCGKKISVQYPLLELATGCIFLLVFFFSPANTIFDLVFLLYIAASLIVIFMYDLKHYLIPDKVLFPAIAVAFACRLLDFNSIFTYVLAALVAAGFFLAIFLASKGRWMGFGDVKLAVLLGLLLGFPAILLCLFLSFLFGAIIGTVLIISNKKGLKSEVPFAPFLIAGASVTLFFGEIIINWYLHFLVF
ncbi:prepilin peptidase [Candidatus Parcubacteria bacterium]|nr:prepilin peptidase [Candidatus Parcubacteria bacterium]